MKPIEVRASAEAPTGCDHDGLHSPQARYSAARGEIRYVTVCDACGAETGEVHRESYAPSFNPDGNTPYISPAA